MTARRVLGGAAQQVVALLGVLSAVILIFAAAAFAGLAILILLFQAGVASGIEIVFYRGIVLCGIAFVLTTFLLAFLGRRTGYIGIRDAVAAGLLSLGLNLSVLVIVPVTLDRSISVFILNHMAIHPGEAFTAEQMEAVFRDRYIDRLQQISRRLDEQQQSGNVIRSDNGHVISPQGLAFVHWARRIAWLFGIDQRLLDDRPAVSAAAGGP